MQKVVQIVGLACALMAACLQPADAEKKLRIANSGDYPPYYVLNEQGQVEGFDVDISFALCQVMQMTCEIVVTPWDGIIQGLVDGQYDAILASMTKTPEREKLVSFTEYYSRSSASFAGRIDAGLEISPEGLQGKVLGVVSGTYQEEYLKKQYDGIATVQSYETTEELWNAVVNGEVDLMLDDSFVIFYFLKDETSGDFDLIGDPLPADDPSNYAYIAVRKEDEALRQAFDKAIRTIRLDGTFEKINKKYFPYSAY